MKIPLEKEEYDYLKKILFSEEVISEITVVSKPEILFKQDEYYSKYDSHSERLENKEPQCIRLRTEKNMETSEATVLFTLKRKTKENGIEVNREDEIQVSDAAVLVDFFNLSGYHRWFNKEKNAISAYCKSESFPDMEFHVELEIVNSLPYVEVEVTEEKLDPEVVKKNLTAFISQLKLNPNKKDGRSWVEILTK